MASVTAAVRQSITENAGWAHEHATRRGCCTTLKDNKLDDLYVYQRTPIRIIGAVMVVFSILEFGVGGFCYGFVTSDHMIGAGAFWAGLLYFILGCLCVWVRTKAVATAALVMACVSWVIGLAGVGLDGSVANEINNNMACSQMLTGNGFGPSYNDYGNPSYFTAADICFLESYPTLSNSICYCSSTLVAAGNLNAKPQCYNMQLGPSANDCAEVFTRYGPALRASAGLCGFLLFLSFFEIVLLSYAMCCERRPEAAPASDDKADVTNPSINASANTSVSVSQSSSSSSSAAVAETGVNQA